MAVLKIALCAHNIWLTYSGPHHRACCNSKSQQGTQRVCHQQRSPDTGPGSGSRSQLHHMGCHRVTAGRKKVKSQPRGRNSLKTSTPAALGIHSRSPTSEGSTGFDLWVCLQIPWEFFPPGGAAFGASWMRVAQFFGTIRYQLAHTLFRLWFFFRARLSVKFPKKRRRCFAEIKRREPPWPAALPLKWRYGEGSSERAFSRTHHRYTDCPPLITPHTQTRTHWPTR